MASDKEFLYYILERLPDRANVSYRPMMGEYLIYYNDRVVGGIYDNRFLVKQTDTSRKLFPDAALELPYEGGKEMIAIDDLEDQTLIYKLLNGMAAELPAPKKKIKDK